jgi:hypothetical protein
MENIVNKFINVTVRIPTSNIVISESHDDIDTAMYRGEILSKALGGSWTMTFNAKQVKI